MSKPLSVLTSTVCALVILAGIVSAGNVSGYDFFTLSEGNVPGTPASGDWTLYATSSGLTVKDDAGATVTLGAGGGGGFTLWVPAPVPVPAPADAVIPGFTTLPTSGHPGLAFDGGTDEDVLMRAVMPAAYVSGDDLTVSLYVTAAGTSQSVEFDIEFAALDGQDIDGAAPSFDAVIAHDGTTSATQGIYTVITTTSANGLVDAVAASELMTIRLTRDADSDASAVDCYVLGVLLSQ